MNLINLSQLLGLALIALTMGFHYRYKAGDKPTISNPDKQACKEAEKARTKYIDVTVNLLALLIKNGKNPAFYKTYRNVHFDAPENMNVQIVAKIQQCATHHLTKYLLQKGDYYTINKDEEEMRLELEFLTDKPVNGTLKVQEKGFPQNITVAKTRCKLDPEFTTALEYEVTKLTEYSSFISAAYGSAHMKSYAECSRFHQQGFLVINAMNIFMSIRTFIGHNLGLEFANELMSNPLTRFICWAIYVLSFLAIGNKNPIIYILHLASAFWLKSTVTQSADLTVYWNVSILIVTMLAFTTALKR